MIKALLLIFEPIAAWERIKAAQRGLPFILLAFLVPTLLLNCLAEGYGLVNWGKWQTEVAILKRFSVREASLFEALQLLLWVLIVLISAKVLKSLAETFHGRHTFTQAFAAVAYGLSPLFLIRLLDCFSGVSPWVTWLIGIMLSIGVLYQGVPRMMEPDPPHAFGLFLMTALLLVFTTGLYRFVTAWYLQGKFPALETLLSGASARLPL
jgi:hypothetical protein